MNYEIQSIIPAAPGWTVEVEEILTKDRKKESQGVETCQVIAWATVGGVEVEGEDTTVSRVDPVWVTGKGRIEYASSYRLLNDAGHVDAEGYRTLIRITAVPPKS